MEKEIIKEGKKIIGFVYKTLDNEFYFAFGKPSQSNYISFKCNSIEHGKECIYKYRNQ